MGYFLAIDVGVERTVAAVARSGADDVETVDLGDGLGDGAGVACVLHLADDGALTVGAAAQEWAATQPDRVVAGFPARIGDEEPMLLAGEPWAPEELTAWLVRWVVDRVAEQEDATADSVVVIHPAAGDAHRKLLLTGAVAEQDLDAIFVAPDGAADGGKDRAVRAAAALRTTVPAPIDDTASGRHAAADGAEGDEEDEPGDDWIVPAPRGHEPDGDGEGGDEEGGQPADRPREVPATANLDPAGFTGGMGAMNTAGLLSGYTPPHGLPETWSGGGVAVATPGTATGRAVALPRQRSDSGRWDAVAPLAEPDIAGAVAPALRARNTPALLVGAGGLAAAVTVVATLFLWPAPRITNSATVQPIPAAPVATAPAVPDASLTPAAAPTPTSRPRPAPPRTRRPVAPAPEPPTAATTVAPTESSEPPDPTTSAPPTETLPPTGDPDDD